jgi:hypothetical protein
MASCGFVQRFLDYVIEVFASSDHRVPPHFPTFPLKSIGEFPRHRLIFSLIANENIAHSFAGKNSGEAAVFEVLTSLYSKAKNESKTNAARIPGVGPVYLHNSAEN